MSQSLYRKYRSRGFDEIVGQSHVTDLLKNAIARGTFAHAYLFTGPRGTGKTSVARILAHAINKLPYTDDSTHLDIIEIDAASNRRIDDIRDLREKVHIAPSSADYKVYIIDEVHMLTGESFNALLKTLEEPPAHAVFILATTELHKVPATIISRTQRFHFRPGSVKDLVGHLSHIAKQEKIAIDDDALTLIARHSEGGFRDSVSLLDQVSSLSEKSISRNDVESLLGLAPSQSIEEIIAASLHGNRDEAVTKLVMLIDEGIHPMSITSQLLISASDQAAEHPDLYELMQQLIEISRSHAPHMKLIATIATFAQSLQTDKQVPKPAKPTAIAQKSDIVVSRVITQTPKIAEPAPVADVVEEPVEPVVTPPKAVIHTDTPIEEFEWAKILVHLKQDTPALYSVVKNAVADYDGDELTIRSHFALHRKKIESEKYMKQLVDCITMQYHACPRIVVADVEKKSLDNVGTQVADIMGGGEAV